MYANVNECICNIQCLCYINECVCYINECICYINECICYINECGMLYK